VRCIERLIERMVLNRIKRTLTENGIKVLIGVALAIVAVSGACYLKGH
jgi:predicted negative regulator of RcsB-dependent stress response